MERRVAGILDQINELKTGNAPIIGGHLSVKNGKYIDTDELFRQNVESQIGFTVAALGYGSPKEYWSTNVYEFYRAFVRAYEVNKRREKAMEKK